MCEIKLEFYAGRADLEEFFIEEGIEEIVGSNFAYSKNLKKISIPSSVVRVGSLAFDGCSSLSRIRLCNGLKYLEFGAFNNCVSLKSIFLPESLYSIGCIPFGGCYNLESLRVSKKNPYFKSKDNCILSKDGTVLYIGCRTSIIPDGVTLIDKGAFYGCKKLKKIVLPRSLKEIFDEAFRGCSSLEVVYMYADIVPLIDPSAFLQCYNLRDVFVMVGSATLTQNLRLIARLFKGKNLHFIPEVEIC